MRGMHGALAWIPLRWLVFLHVASAMGLLLAHGGSATAMLRLRHENEVERVKALLELSGSTLALTWVALLALGLTGVLLMLIEHTWRLAWAWGSIIVLAALSASMSALGARPFNRMRHAAGLPWFDGRRRQAGGAIDPEAVERERARLRPRLLLALGLLGYALLLWLMMFRPTLG